MRPNRKALHLLLFLSFSLALSFISLRDAWSMHQGMKCATCHQAMRREARNDGASAGEAGALNSAACLSCHDSERDQSGLNPPHVLNGAPPLAGGTFTPTQYADQVGHNVLSLDRILGLNPPGGDSMKEFSCMSCHDPHDNGNYRNLRTEINHAPTPVQAVADPLYLDNIYISGMNEFCTSCHERFHGEANTRGQKSWVRHPTGITIYGARHADFTGWSQREPGLTLVENPSGNPNDLYGARVFCLSCHFAHAGPYDNAVRWDNARSNKGCLECHSLDSD